MLDGGRMVSHVCRQAESLISIRIDCTLWNDVGVGAQSRDSETQGR